MSPLYFLSILLKATLLGSYWDSGRLPVPANFKKVWKKRKNFKNLQHLMPLGTGNIGTIYAIRDGEYWHNLCIHKGQTKNDNIRMYEKSKITMYKHTFFFVYFFTGGYTKNGKTNSSIKDFKRNESKAKLFSIS